MPINYTFYVVVAIFAMFFGYFFGLIEGRMQGYKKRKKEEEKERQAAPEAAAPPSPAVEAPPAPQPLPPPSLLRLFQDENGQLGLDLDDQRVNTAALTGQQRKRLVELLTRMRPWLDVPKPPASAPTPQPASVSRQSPAPQPTPPPPSAPAVPPYSTPAPKAIVPGPIVPIESPPKAPDSIVTQIDAILQARLIGTPLEDQGIKLREAPDGSVLVHVGSRVYQSVEEVPDETIKVALRAAIAEWEKKFTPGL